MINLINDSVRFQEDFRQVQTITRIYNTYPYKTYQAAVAISGIDYGFSEQEGLFFRSQIQTKTTIVNVYTVRVEVTFGFRSREFDKKTDATVNYTLTLNQTNP